ncbi:MAG: hypothetical protein EOM48_04895 [Bacilli bacterium]|nr:hypothetical protein [Bacilli bacterium]
MKNRLLPQTSKGEWSVSLFAAFLASLMGILAVKKDQERSILVFLLIPIGLFFLVAIVGFMIANLIGPPD